MRSVATNGRERIRGGRVVFARRCTAACIDYDAFVKTVLSGTTVELLDTDVFECYRNRCQNVIEEYYDGTASRGNFARALVQKAGLRDGLSNAQCQCTRNSCSS